MFATEWFAPTVGALAVIAAAVLPAWLTIHKRLGKPNGGGTVVGEIALVKAEAKRAADAATSAAASASSAASAALTAATAAQLAAAMSEENGTQIERLTERVKIVETEIGLVPRQPF